MLPGEIGFMDLIGFCNAFGRKIGQNFSSLENLLSFQVYNFYMCQLVLLQPQTISCGSIVRKTPRLNRLSKVV